jgi:general secretion pathway protein C
MMGPMGLDTTLRRLQTPIFGGIVLIVALLQARGIGAIVAGHLVPTEPTPIGKGTPHSATPAAGKDPTAILERNPFDSVTGPLNKTAGSAKITPDQPEKPVASLSGDPYEDTACTGVRATLVTATDDPAWSFAAISSGDGEQMRRIGDKVGAQTVVHIGYYESPNLESTPRVWLQDAGARCIVPVTGPEPTKKPDTKTPTEPKSKKAKEKAKLEAEVKSKITKIGEGSFEVDRSGVEIIMQHYAKLAGSIRARGAKDGSGIRLSGIKGESILGELGMKNGDMLTGINGFDMTDPEKAVDAYAKLRKAGKLDISMTRDGSPVNIKIQIK